MKARKLDIDSMTTAGIGLFAFLVCLRKIGTFDYWTNLAVGRHFVENGLLALAEPFQTQTAQAPLSAPWWPFQIVLYYIRDTFSDVGVSIFVALCAFVLAVILADAIRGVKGWRKHAGTLLILAVIFVGRERFTPRSEVVAFIFVAFTIRFALAWSRRPSVWHLPGGAALVFLWAQMHVSWTIGAAFSIFLVATCPQIDFWRERWRTGSGKAFTVLICMALAAGAVGAGSFAWRILSGFGSGGEFALMTEMLPIWNFPSLAIQFFCVMGAVLFVCCINSQGRTRRVLFSVAALALGTVVARNLTFAMVLALPVALDGLRLAKEEGEERAQKRTNLLAMALAPVVGLALLFIVMTDHDPAWGPAGVEWPYFPRESAAFVIDNALPAEVFNSFDIGGYLDWSWKGTPPIFIDGRGKGGETFLLDFQRLTDGVGLWPLLDRYGINTVITRGCYLSSGRIFPNVLMLLAHPNWRLVFAADALVFTRANVRQEVATLAPVAGWDYLLREVTHLEWVDPDRPHLRFTKALAFYNLGRIEEARREFFLAVAAHPELEKYYATLAVLLRADKG